MSKSRILAWLTWLVYGAVVVVPLIFYRYSMLHFGIPKVMLFQILVELAAALWLGLVLMDRRYLPKRTWIFWSLILFGAVLLLSGIFGADPYHSFWSSIDRHIGVVGLLHIILFAIVLMGIGPELPWLRIWKAAFYTSIAVAISVFLTKWGLASFFLNQNIGRPGGTFGNALYVGQYLLFAVFIGGWLLFQARSKAERWIIGAGLALNVAAIFVTQTIGIILSLIFGIAIVLAHLAWRGTGRAKFISRLALGAGAVLILAVTFTRAAPVWQKIPGLSRVAVISTNQTDVQDRLIAWRTAWEGFKEKPILGWGWENASIPFSKHYTPELLLTGLDATFFDKPHNVYLEHLATGGILGLLGYIGIFVALGIALKNIWKKGEEYTATFFAAGVAAYLLQNTIAFDTIGTYIWLALVLAFANTRAYTREEHGEAAVAPQWKTQAALGLLILAFIPAWLYNVNVMRMANHYYWGINYFLNGLPEASELSWRKAMALGTPYREAVRRNYANIIQQGFQQDIRLPDFDSKQAEGASIMSEIADKHPYDYFFQIAAADYYITLAPYSREAYFKKAAEFIERAKALSPNRQQTYYVLARLKLSENKREEALRAFRDAIALNPNAGEPHFTYGMLLYGLGRAEEGRAEIQRATELGRTPRNVDEAVRLASFQADIDHNYRAAVENLRLALNLLGNAVRGGARELDIRFKLGVAHYLAGQNAEAKEQLQFVADRTDLTKAANWSALKPALDELGVKYEK